MLPRRKWWRAGREPIGVCLAIIGLVEQGDEVIYPNPGFPI